MKVVIIEDELHIAERLEDILRELEPEVQVLQRIRSIAEGLSYFKSPHDHDLIFSDIELLDGRSFEIFRQCPQTTPIIFCTAFDEFALQAFEVNGIDYILKPFSEKRIAETLEKYKRLVGSKAPSDLSSVTSLLRWVQSRESGRILAQKGEKIIPIAHQDIAVIHLENGITYLTTFDSQRFHINERLDALEQVLGPDFYRLNRQVLIQRKAVAHTAAYHARKMKVSTMVKFDGDLIVSKAGVSTFLNWLKG